MDDLTPEEIAEYDAHLDMLESTVEEKDMAYWATVKPSSLAPFI